MKICVLGTRGFPFIQGGVEKHCESLYTGFSLKYHFIIFRRKPYIKSSISYPNITFVDLPSTKIKGVETVFHSFLATCYSVLYHPNIVHIHNIGPAMFSPILRFFGLKTVLTFHSPNYEHKKWGRGSRILLKWSEKIALKISDAVIFVNRFQMEKYDSVIRNKSYYIPNGIPEILPTNATNYIESLGLKKGKYVLSVGRITPEKGFDCLLKAFARLNDTDCRVVIAGGVETESTYYNMLRTILPAEKVIFTGYVYGEELSQLYTHARLFILPSYNEGFPLVLLEAMSYGLDMLVSDIPATHLVDLATDDYFEKGNDEILAKKISAKLGQVKKRKYQLEPYSWRSVIVQTGNVYESVKRGE